MSIYLASDKQPVLAYRHTAWMGTVWDIVIGDQRIIVSAQADSSPPVAQRHEHILTITRIEMLSAVDPDGLRESLEKEARRAAVEKGVPMPPGIEPTIEHPPADGNAFLLVEYRWVWWSVTL